MVMQPHEAVAVRLGIDMKLFDAASVGASDGRKVRIEQLVSDTDADPLLISEFETEKNAFFE